jgi:site-specific DNA-methyltransferase (adenine-specific)
MTPLRLRVYPLDCRAVLPRLADNSVDAIVTDPPYGLEFMGKEWDRFSGACKDRNFKGFTLSQQRTRNVKCPDCNKWAYDHPGRLCECGGIRRAQGSVYQAWCESWAAECLRVLKPGGHLLAFGGTRTYHRLACAIEDAGFEFRDSIHWFYGSGFPKSRNVSKAIDKAAGAERTEVIGARHRNVKPYDDANGWNPNNTTGDYAYTAPASEDAARWEGWGTTLKPAHEPIVVARKPLAGTVAQNVLEWGTGALNIDGCLVGTTKDDPGTGRGWNANTGRWPPNLLLTHSADCNGQCVPDCPVAELDRQSGLLASGKGTVRRASGADRNGNTSAALGSESRASGTEMVWYGDTGGASRFFPQLNWDEIADFPFLYQAKAGRKERPRTDAGKSHPTVKPRALMRWLVKLVTPPDGVVLDPFAGTGTTGEACLLEGFRAVLCENDPDSLEMIGKRLASYGDWQVRP